MVDIKWEGRMGRNGCYKAEWEGRREGKDMKEEELEGKKEWLV